MKKLIGWLIVAAVLGAAAFGIYLWSQGPTYQPMVEEPVEAPPPVATAEPEVHYPVPEIEEEKPEQEPLPALEKSDPLVSDTLSGLFGSNAAKKFFQPQEIIRRIVVTIDNLPRKTASAQLLPTKPPEGKFMVDGQGATLAMAPANTARYTPYVKLIEAVNTQKLVAAYVRLYPLFQQAYRNLGYPEGHFNNRLVAVIDHLLAAPESKGKIMLVQPHIFYKFADPTLEALSAGHKLMLRIGNENAAVIKKKLREVRSELASGAVKSQTPAQAQ
jgi:hypothetical protein